MASTAAVQQTLKLAGFWDGPVDGEWTPELTEALKDFQTELGVEPTGTVDAATIAALEKAIADATPESSAATTSASPTSSLLEHAQRADRQPFVRMTVAHRRARPVGAASQGAGLTRVG